MNTTIAQLTMRALLGRRRSLLLLPLPVLLLGLILLSQHFGATPESWGTPIIVGLGLSVMLPVVALVVGTGVLGAEIDDGTVLHILAKPLPRSQIVLTKLAVSVGVTWVTTAVPLYLAGLLANSVRLAVGLALGALVASLAYSGVFLALSLLTRRPVLVGLGYVLLWEGLLTNLLTGTRVLSIQQYALAVAGRVAHAPEVVRGNVSVPLALVLAGVILVGGTVLAVDRLRSFQVAGETS